MPKHGFYAERAAETRDQIADDRERMGEKYADNIQGHLIAIASILDTARDHGLTLPDIDMEMLDVSLEEQGVETAQARKRRAARVRQANETRRQLDAHAAAALHGADLSGANLRGAYLRGAARRDIKTPSRGDG